MFLRVGLLDAVADTNRIEKCHRVSVRANT